MRERKVRTFNFQVVARRRREPRVVYRCFECRALTDDAQGHAEWHAEITMRGTPNPSNDWVTVDVEIRESGLLPNVVPQPAEPTMNLLVTERLP